MGTDACHAVLPWSVADLGVVLMVLLEDHLHAADEVVAIAGAVKFEECHLASASEHEARAPVVDSRPLAFGEVDLVAQWSDVHNIACTKAQGASAIARSGSV